MVSSESLQEYWWRVLVWHLAGQSGSNIEKVLTPSQPPTSICSGLLLIVFLLCSYWTYSFTYYCHVVTGHAQCYWSTHGTVLTHPYTYSTQTCTFLLTHPPTHKRTVDLVLNHPYKRNITDLHVRVQRYWLSHPPIDCTVVLW